MLIRIVEQILSTQTCAESDFWDFILPENAFAKILLWKGSKRVILALTYVILRCVKKFSNNFGGANYVFGSLPKIIALLWKKFCAHTYRRTDPKPQNVRRERFLRFHTPWKRVYQDSTLKGFKKSDFSTHTCDFEMREKFFKHLWWCKLCVWKLA